MPVFLKRNPLLDVTAVSNVFLLEYMPKAPEGFTKAYLLGLMQTGAPGAEAAGLDVSGVLGVSETELARAFAYWQAAGLVRIVSDAPLTVEYLPAGASSGLAAGDAPRKYASLVAALQDVAGTRVFSGHELSEIYDWIEAFRFEETTAVLCVKDCLARCGARAKLWQMNATDIFTFSSFIINGSLCVSFKAEKLYSYRMIVSYIPCHEKHFFTCCFQYTA